MSSIHTEHPIPGPTRDALTYSPSYPLFRYPGMVEAGLPEP